MKNFFTWMLAWLILPFAANAQVTLSGSITDNENNKPVCGANIRIENTFLATFSDSKGEFNIPKVKKGTYLLKVSCLGYKTYTKEVSLQQSTHLDIILQHNSILTDEVIISSTRVKENAPTTFNNLDQKEIKKVNMGRDLPFMMESMPSVVVTSDAGNGIGYTGMRIRGTDMSRINVTINGIPYNEAETQEVYFVDVPDLASSIDNVQVQRGVGTSSNGAATFGGSINIETNKINAEPYAEINSAYGSFNSARNSANFGTGMLAKHWTIDGRVSVVSSDGFIDRATSNLKSYMLSGTYVGKKDLVKFNIISGSERTYLAWDGIPSYILDTNRTYNGFTYKNETDNYQQDHYQLFYSREFTKDLFLNTALHYTRGKGYYEQYKEGKDFTDYGIDPLIIGNDTITQTNLVQRKWMSNYFYGGTWSLDYKKNSLSAILGGAYNEYIGDHYGRVIWAQYASNAFIDYEWYRNDGTKKDFNSYLKVNYSLLDKISLYGDMQYRHVYYKLNGIDDDYRVLTQNHSYDFFNPKAGISYDLSDNNNLYFSFAIANREPSRSNFKDADPGLMPKPEQLYDYELGYRFKTTVASFTANLYYMNYKDQLVLTGKINDVGAAIMTNVPKSYRQGIELSSIYAPCKYFSWDANLTLSENKIKNFSEYVDNWDEGGQVENKLGTTDLSFSPNVVANNRFTVSPFKNFSVNILTKYVGKQYADNTSSNDRSLDAYLVNNLMLNYTFSTKLIKNIGFSLQINNLLDEEYETNAWVYRYYYEGTYSKEDGYFPQAGRNVMAGVNLKF